VDDIDTSPTESVGRNLPEGDRRDRPPWLPLLVVLALVVTVGLVVWFSGVFQNDPEVEVPEVVGLDQRAARQRLRDVGLRIERIEEASSVRVSAGIVTAQTPSAGSLVPRGTELMLVVARGIEEGKVPDVQHLDVEEAIQAIEAAGFEVVIKEQPVEDGKEGSVLSQSPAEGEAAPGGEVTITVAVGLTPDIRTPAVVGTLQPAAVSILHDAGLAARSYWVRGSTSREIVHQYPPAGMLVAPGTVVELQVSLGADSPNLPTGGIGP